MDDSNQLKYATMSPNAGTKKKDNVLKLNSGNSFGNQLPMAADAAANEAGGAQDGAKR